MNIVFTKSGDVWGPEGITDGFTIEITFTTNEANDLLQEYDPLSTSPSEETSRLIARKILDALKTVSG